MPPKRQERVEQARRVVPETPTHDSSRHIDLMASPSSNSPSRAYRSATSLPYTLLERIRVSFEENLHEQGIEFLSAVLFSGLSTPSSGSDHEKPVLIPPPTFLRFLLTLMVHPYYTTQSRKGQRPSTAPRDAYLCMRRVIEIIGPMNADLGTVWSFDRGGRGERSRRHKKEASPVSSEDSLSGELANEESLFSRAEDVWSVVGWAFTCSVQHPGRWTWYKNLLDCLLMALERDWEQRWRRFEEGGMQHDELLRESMVVKLLPDTRGTAGYRRVIRATLATGAGSGANEFHMIWDDELLPKRPKSKGQGKIGGFMSKYSDLNEDPRGEPKTPSSAKKKKQPAKKSLLDEDDFDELDEGEDVEMEDVDTTIPSVANEWGGMEALQLRTRFLSLIAEVALREQYTPAPTLYREYAQFVLPFSLDSFKLYITTLIHAPIGYRCTLAQFVLEAILSPSAPPARPDDMYALSQEVMIRRFLPYTANSASVVDNAKFAVSVEVLLRMLLDAGLLRWSQELEDAVETGIAAREKKASFSFKGGSHGKLRPEEQQAVKLHWKVAEESIRTVIRMVRLQPSSQE